MQAPSALPTTPQSYTPSKEEVRRSSKKKLGHFMEKLSLDIPHLYPTLPYLRGTERMRGTQEGKMRLNN